MGFYEPASHHEGVGLHAMTALATRTPLNERGKWSVHYRGTV